MRKGLIICLREHSFSRQGIDDKKKKKCCRLSYKVSLKIDFTVFDTETTRQCESSKYFQFRDCYTACDTSRCNTGTEVAEKFPDGKQKSCHTCFYKEENDGTVSGNTNCPNLS